MNIAIRKYSGFILIALILLVLEFLSRTNIVSTLFLPPPSQIFFSLLRLLSTSEYWMNVGSTLARVMAGYLIACIVGIGFGVFLGSFRFLYSLFEPIIEFLRPIPSVAVIPIAILFLGIGDTMKIFIVAFACSWPILVNTITGIRTVDNVQIETGKVFGMKNWQIIYFIKLPNALIFIFAGMRISLAIAVILGIATEMVSSINGLGRFILDSQRSFEIADMYAGVVTIATIGYLLNKTFLVVEGRVIRWHRQMIEGV